jgi:hypothetical protein
MNIIISHVINRLATWHISLWSLLPSPSWFLFLVWYKAIYIYIYIYVNLYRKSLHNEKLKTQSFYRDLTKDTRIDWKITLLYKDKLDLCLCIILLNSLVYILYCYIKRYIFFILYRVEVFLILTYIILLRER